ncbi:MAG: hypothetical protein RR011_00550, partial [Oscillospiraceae bacterium]
MFIIKKFISIFLAAAICLSLSGCKKGDGQIPNPDSGADKEKPVVIEQREYNYLTGKAFAEGQDKTARPIAVMINNAKLA